MLSPFTNAVTRFDRAPQRALKSHWAPRVKWRLCQPWAAFACHRQKARFSDSGHDARDRRLCTAAGCAVATLMGEMPSADYVLHVPRQPGEIVEHGLDQYFPTGILSAGSSLKQGQQIAHLIRGFFPIGCRSGDQLRFQRVLRRAQRPFIGGDLCEEATKISGLLRGHSAMLVELDRFVCHDVVSRSRAA